jgi:molecular chaperone HscB
MSGAPASEGRDPAEAPDLFSVLGLPRRFAVDPGELERRFHECSRAVHPDRFARAEPRERRLAVARSMRVNEAYRTLRNSRSRAAYLLSLLDAAGPAAPARVDDPAFLEEQLAVREALARARAAGDAQEIRRIVQDARAALAGIEAAVGRHFAAWEERGDGSPLEAAREALARARFLDALLGDAELPGGAAAR